MKTISLCLLALLICSVGFAQGVVKSAAPIKNEKLTPSLPPEPSGLKEHLYKSSHSATDDPEPSEWHVGGPTLSHFHNLQDAINSEEVKYGDIIYIYTNHVANGYPVEGIYIYKDLEIVGITDNEFVALNGGANKLSSDRRCVTIAQGVKVTMRNISMCNGNASDGEYGMGGAIYNNGHLILDDVFIYSNLSNYGGGAIHNAGILEVSNSFFNTNDSYLGGAISNSGTMKLDNIIFSYCRASGFGGAIYTFETGSEEISNSRFEHCSAESSAGVHYNWGYPVYKNCRIWDNKAINYLGGTIVNEGQMNISACVFYDNTAETLGGAISNSGILFVDHSAFYNNRCNQYQGGAIANFANMYLYRVTASGNSGYGAIGNSAFYDDTEKNANAYLINCTVTNNTNPDCSGISLHEETGSSYLSLVNSIVANNKGGGYDIEQYNAYLSTDGCNILGSSDSSYLFMVSDMPGIDPQLDELSITGLEVPFHQPLPHSPAINAIANETRNAEQATGDPYFFNSPISPNGLYDIGAYETNESQMNSAVWSIWENYNPGTSIPYNVSIPWETDLIWHPAVNNLHIGTEGILHVTEALELEGKLFYNGKASSLVLYEGIEFKQHENYLVVPEIASLDCQTGDDENFTLTIETHSHGLAFNATFEYGKSSADYDLRQYNDTIRLEEKIDGNILRTYTYHFKAPGLIDGYYRIRLTGEQFTFVTAPRRATNKSDFDEKLYTMGIKILSTNNTLRIENRKNEIRAFRLINMGGQCVFTCEPASQQQLIEKHNLVSGWYIATVKTTKGDYVSKVLIK
ncbi:T9SS type A sorting domain-containing protein [Roseimarinus sediminis]|uniref:T9SS type A sorting domain-containing protein n=1 Tax=Roseimarinus sediminis TaxID=1610899 RepID=UPI003D200D5E